MELVSRIFSYTNFQYVSTDLSKDTSAYVLKLKTLSGFTSYDATNFDYNGITSALYSQFPPNQFTTSPDGLSGYTIVNFIEPHDISIGEYILLKPLFGDDNLLGLNVVTDVGDILGGDADNNVWVSKPYTAYTGGLAITQINEVLAFFKGFNIQPTYESINTYLDYIDAYLGSPDVNSFLNVGVGEYIRNTPRRLFNEVGYILTNITGGTEDAQINLPIYLTQTMQNIGVYELPYSSATDDNNCMVLPMPESYYRRYSITERPVIISAPANNFTYILTDGITANTYSDFYELSPSQVSGYTSDKSIRVRKYVGDEIRNGYQLPSAPGSLTYTLTRNTVAGVNDGYVEYTTNRPMSAATRSFFSVNSWGRSPQNDNVGNVVRPFVSMVHDEINDKLVLEPKIKNDVFIDRGVFSPFERVFKLGYMRSLEDITSFERGEFNVVKGTPLDRSYLLNS
jgi:hypothetical protein